jgi:hypothetical protein
MACVGCFRRGKEDRQRKKKKERRSECQLTPISSLSLSPSIHSLFLNLFIPENKEER